jgi:hypothetical protein
MTVSARAARWGRFFWLLADAKWAIDNYCVIPGHREAICPQALSTSFSRCLMDLIPGYTFPLAKSITMHCAGRGVPSFQKWSEGIIAQSKIAPPIEVAGVTGWSSEEFPSH